MTILNEVMMILGAGCVAVNVMRLIDWLDRPHGRRRTV